MLRVLLISPFFFPEEISTGKYNTTLARSLVRHGHHVTAIVSYPLYPDWQPTRSDSGVPGVNIHRGGLWVRYPRSAVFRRIILEFWFALFTIKAVWGERNRTDVAVFVFPPNIFALLARRLLPTRARKVGIIHDLQGVMATATESHFRKLVARVMRSVERHAFCSCDQLICLSESMRDEVSHTYGIAPNKLKVHYPFATMPDLRQRDGGVAALFPKGYTHIVYSGALGEKQKPIELVALFRAACEARGDVMCHIFSGGPLFMQISRAGAKTIDSRLQFHGLVPECALDTLYSCSTVQVIPQAPGTGAGAFPSKLPNLLAAGVPVFAICDEDSELARVVKETSFGTAVHSWNKQQCVAELLGFADRVKGEDREQRRIDAARYVAEKFDVAGLVKTIIGQ